MQTIAFGVDKQWDPAVQPRELYLVTYGTWWRIMWEKNVCVYVCVCVYIYIYIYVTGSLCCTVEHCKSTIMEKIKIIRKIFAQFKKAH